MNNILKISGLIVFVCLITLSSCEKEETTIPINDSTEITDQEQVELDLKNGEPKDTTKTDKGNKKYCEALKEKMGKLSKDSKEMAACMKLYKYKCTDCKHDKTDKDLKTYCEGLKLKLAKTEKGSKEFDELTKLLNEKCIKGDKNKGNYCKELKTKLAKTKKDTKEYNEIMKLLKEKCK